MSVDITSAQFEPFAALADDMAVRQIASKLPNWMPGRLREQDSEGLESLVRQMVGAARERGVTGQSGLAVCAALGAALGPAFLDSAAIADLFEDTDDLPDQKVVRLASLPDDAWAAAAGADATVKAQIGAVARGLIEKARSEFPDSPPSPATRCPLRSPVKDKPGHWIEVILLDDEGHPVPEVRCRFEFADGKVFEGVSGKTGLVRVTGIAAGVAKVSFPDLDHRSWSRV